MAWELTAWILEAGLGPTSRSASGKLCKQSQLRLPCVLRGGLE